MTHFARRPRTFHLSLNVADLERSVEFFRRVFGTEPAKCRPDYAKFELSDPPVALSLEPSAPGSGGALNHVGFRLESAEALAELQRRLELAGLGSRQEEVECCYSKQTKFWLHDPDGTLWEFYVLGEDLENRGDGQTAESFTPPAAAPAAGSAPAAPVADAAAAPGSGPTWSHRLGQPFPERIAADGERFAAVQLQGTFNADPATRGETAAVLGAVRAALRPGGRLAVHCLTADRPPEGPLALPGPAAAVRAVPVDRELIAALNEAGFLGVRLLKFGAAPCFSVGGARMRETMLEAFAPAEDREAAGGEPVTVVYRGPFQSVTLPGGEELRCGERVALPAGVWAGLANTPLAEAFAVLAAGSDGASCGG